MADYKYEEVMIPEIQSCLRSDFDALYDQQIARKLVVLTTELELAEKRVEEAEA